MLFQSILVSVVLATGAMAQGWGGNWGKSLGATHPLAQDLTLPQRVKAVNARTTRTVAGSAAGRARAGASAAATTDGAATGAVTGWTTTADTSAATAVAER
jgi:hypothetical protein